MPPIKLQTENQGGYSNNTYSANSSGSRKKAILVATLVVILVIVLVTIFSTLGSRKNFELYRGPGYSLSYPKGYILKDIYNGVNFSGKDTASIKTTGITLIDATRTEHKLKEADYASTLKSIETIAVSELGSGSESKIFKFKKKDALMVSNASKTNSTKKLYVIDSNYIYGIKVVTANNDGGSTDTAEAIIDSLSFST